MPLVSIIILNWNGLVHLPDCLESLKKQTFGDFECVMVDNGSSDGSLDYLEKHHPWVRLIRLDKNTGFAAGNVTGYAHSSGKYIVALNNDTIVEPDWLEQLVKKADELPEAGMIGSRICSDYDRDVIDSLGMNICIDGMSRGAFRGRKFSQLKNIPEKILLPSACAALYKRAMLDETGFFDESFFAYCEDTDLGLRGRLAGWDAVLAKDAVVYHKYSATAGSFSPFKLYLVERNHFWAAVRCLPVLLLILLPVTTLLRYLVQAVAVLRSSGSGGALRTSASPVSCIAAAARGLLHGMAGLPAALKKRFCLRGRRTGDAAMLRLIFAFRMSFFELLDLK